MKKLFLLFLTVLCFSCEKKNDRCWRCEMINVVSSELASENSRTVTTVDTCNITQLEIDDIEKRFK
jgi:predicted secreted protein